MEPAGHHRGDAPAAMDLREELPHPRGRLDAGDDPLEGRHRNTREGLDAGAEGSGEIHLAAHRCLGRRGDFGTAPGFVGEQLDHLVPDEGRIGVEHDEERGGVRHPHTLLALRPRRARPCRRS